MSLQHSSRSGLRAHVAVIVALIVAGCASGPAPLEDAGVDGTNPAAVEITAEAQSLFDQAVAAMQGGDTLDAELRFQEFLLQYPGYPGAYVNLAIILAERGDYLAAEASLGEALAIDPAHPVALNRLGMVRRAQGMFTEAEEAYQRAIEADPDYALAHYNLGVLNDLYLRRSATAVEHYERYQALAGEDAQVAKWIADLKRRIGVEQRTANVTE